MVGLPIIPYWSKAMPELFKLDGGEMAAVISYLTINSRIAILLVKMEQLVLVGMCHHFTFGNISHSQLFTSFVIILPWCLSNPGLGSGVHGNSQGNLLTYAIICCRTIHNLLDQLWLSLTINISLLLSLITANRKQS